MKTNEFITKLLLEAIHQEECSNNFHEVYKKAERIVRWKFDDREDPSYVLMHQMINCIRRLKNMVSLCNHLNKKGIKVEYGCIPKEENYYIDIFRSRVTKGRDILRKLRPYVLEYTKNFNKERKLQDLNDPKLNPFLKGWYITEEK